MGKARRRKKIPEIYLLVLRIRHVLPIGTVSAPRYKRRVQCSAKNASCIALYSANSIGDTSPIRENLNIGAAKASRFT
jgi:hypothetical protein